MSAAVDPRERILTGARRHFLAHGFRSVTMDDLAAELGMSKKTLYAHFPSKAALLEAVLLSKFAEVETDLEAITGDESRDFMTALHDLLVCVQRHTSELKPPFVRDMRKKGASVFKVVETRRRELVQHHFGKIFARGRKAGLIRKDIPVPVIMEILLGAVEAVVNPEKITQLKLTPRQGFTVILDVILDVILEGVMTERRKETDS